MFKLYSVLKMVSVVMLLGFYESVTPQVEPRNDIGPRSSETGLRSTVRNLDFRTMHRMPKGSLILGGRTTLFEVKDGQEKIREVGILVRLEKDLIILRKLPFLNEVRYLVFLDEHIGFIAGPQGIFKTNDGGLTWERNEHIVDFRGPFFFLDKDVGWYFGLDEYLNQIVGSRGSKLKSFEDFPFEIKRLQFVNRTKGWLHDVVNGKTRFQVTKDGGLTWNEVRVDDTPLLDFQFTDNRNGYLLNLTGAYRSQNGGETWEIVKRSSPTENYKRLYFLDSQFGWLIGSDICSTQNAGDTWDCRNIPKDIMHIRKITFTDKDNGWILMENGLYNSADGGQSWKRFSVNVGNYVF